MCEESDQEITEFDIESKSWQKIEKNMKLIGFREGAAKGRDLSLQQGFNLGYSDGFRTGESLGIVKGKIRCLKELGISNQEVLKLDEKELNILSSQACASCPNSKNYEEPLSDETHSEKFEQLISRQQDHNNDILKALMNSNFHKYLEKE